MVCPISQPPAVSLRRSSKPKNVLGGTFSVASGLRSYSPELGRWVNRDPIGEKGNVGLAIFVHNSPILLVDFLGMSAAGIPGALEILDRIACDSQGTLPIPFPAFSRNLLGIVEIEVKCELTLEIIWEEKAEADCKNELFKPYITSGIDKKFFPSVPFWEQYFTLWGKGITPFAELYVDGTVRTYWNKWYDYGLKYQASLQGTAQGLRWVDKCCKCAHLKADLKCDGEFKNNSFPGTVVGSLAALYAASAATASTVIPEFVQQGFGLITTIVGAGSE